jgi:hypothetical protein
VQIERSLRHGEKDGQKIIFHEKEIGVHAGGAACGPPLFAIPRRPPPHSLFAANRVFPDCPA